MQKDRIKLVSKGKFPFMILAIVTGVGIFVITRFFPKGYLTTLEIVGAIGALVIGFITILLVIWWANRPRKEENNK